MNPPNRILRDMLRHVPIPAAEPAQERVPSSRPTRRNAYRFIDIEILEARIAPATLIWDGSAGDSDWFNPQNWDQNAVPSTGDTAILDIASTINLTASATVASFQLSAGMLASPTNVTLTITSSFTWIGGTMSGAGPTSITKIAAAATLAISGAATKTLQLSTLSNDGTAIWSGTGELVLDNGGVFENGGSFIAQSNAILRSLGSGNSFLNKAGGSFDKNTGTGTTEMQVAFANTGIVTAASGTLHFAGSFDQTASLTRLSGGSVSTTSVLTLTGGELTGSGTITGNVNNIGATVRPGTNGAGLLTVSGNYTQGSGGTLAIEIGGTTVGTQYDQLNVTGTATLGGNLTSAYINGFTSTATGNVFNALVAGNRVSTFAAVKGVVPLTGNYTATQVQFVNNAITYVWDGSAGDGNWFTASNWTPSGVPGAADFAILNIFQTINLPSSAQVGYFQQTNGTFTSPAGVAFTVLHDFYWTNGGKMTGSGVTNANGGLVMTGYATLDGRTLNVPAGQTAIFNGNVDFRLQNGGRINNAGTFLVPNDGVIQNDGGATLGLFNNTGSFIRDTTTGIFQIRVPFANSGTVNLGAGTLAFTAGDNGTTTGDFNIVDGSRVDFSGGTFTLGSSADVAGTGRIIVSNGSVAFGGNFAMRKVTVSGGTATVYMSATALEELIVSGGTASFNATAALNLTTLTISNGGVLNSASTINVASLLSWTYGTIGGSGVTNANGGLLVNSQGNYATLDGHTLNVPAGQTATLSGNAYLQMKNGARINNAGTFFAQTTDSRFDNGGGVASLFSNTGTFIRDTGTGILTIGVPFANSGTVNLATGTLRFTAGEGGPMTGDFNIVDGSRVDFGGGNFTLGSTADVAGTGRVIVSGGTAVFGGSFAMHKLTASGGAATFNVPPIGLEELIVSGGTIGFNAGVTLDLAALATLTVSGGTLSFNTGNTLNLTALTTLTFSGGTFTSVDPLNLANLATLTVSYGTATFNATAPLNLTTLTISNGGVLNSASTINVASLLSWTYGTIGGSGVTNANGGLLVNSQGNYATLDGHTLNVPAGQTATLSGNAYLQMKNGARINNAGTFFAQTTDSRFDNGGGVASLFSNTGTFIRDTGTGILAINVPFANSGVVNAVTNAPTFTAGFTQAAGGSILGGKQVNFTGGVVAVGGTMVANVSNTGAVFSPGESGVGALSITGNYVQGSSGTLKADLGGAASGEFDKLTISGTANLAGSLNVNVLPGFAPLANQQFAVLSAAAVAGSFGSQSGVAGFTAGFPGNGLVLTKTTTNYTWDGGGGVDDSWFTAANWSPDGVPTASDNATLSSAGTITLSSAVSVLSFTQSNGIVIGAGTLTATTFTWSGGTQAGAGKTAIPIGGTFNLQGTATKSVTQRTIELVGAGVWTGTGALQMGNGAVFNNSGTFDLQSNASLDVNFISTPPLFANSGTVQKTVGTGTTTFNGLRFENSGTLRVSTGTLALAGAGSSFTQASGAMILAGGNFSTTSTLQFGGGVLSGAGTITGNVDNYSAIVQPGGMGVAGALTITGTYSQGTSATLAIELGGAGQTAYDRLLVTGAATFNGNLDVALIGGFTPAPGQEYGIVTYASRTGTLTGPDKFAQEYRTTSPVGLVLKPVFPTLTIDDVRVIEGNSGPSVATFTVTLFPLSTQTVTLQYATANSTASAGEDYLARSLTTLTFNPGEVTKTITVIINGDTSIELAETFFVNLSGATNANLGDAQGLGTILNDEIDLTIPSGGKTAKYTDADGDAVTIQTTMGAFSAANFVFAPDGTLTLLDLKENSLFAGTSLVIAAVKASSGDGLINVGAIMAIGLDLGAVTITGDLGQIDVGDVIGSTPALQSLTVGSLGMLGATTQPLGTVDPLQSDIRGSIGTLKVLGNVQNAVINVFVGNIGSIDIGGALDGSGGGLDAGLISARGHIGPVKITGGMIGGAGRSGLLAGGTIGKITVGGDVKSDQEVKPVTIQAGGRLGALPTETAAITGLDVSGNVRNAKILARTTVPAANLNGYTATVGDVIVGGDWKASSLAAGIADRGPTGLAPALPDGFGRNDVILDRGFRALTSKIASVIISGTATGSADGGFFGITARKIGKTIIGPQPVLLTDAADDRLLDFTNGNFRLVDFA